MALVTVFLVSCCWSAAAKASHHIARSCQSTILLIPTTLDNSCCVLRLGQLHFDTGLRTAFRAREQSPNTIVIPGSKQQGTEQNMSLNIPQCLQGLHMGCLKPVLLIWLASVAVGSTWAASPTAEDVIGTSCGVALDVLSQCASSAEDEKLAATCCTPYAVLKSFNCFW